MEESRMTYTTYASYLLSHILNLGGVPPCRLVSPVLANFPWYSAALCDSDDLSEVADDAFQVWKPN